MELVKASTPTPQHQGESQTGPQAGLFRCAVLVNWSYCWHWETSYSAGQWRAAQRLFPHLKTGLTFPVWRLICLLGCWGLLVQFTCARFWLHYHRVEDWVAEGSIQGGFECGIQCGIQVLRLIEDHFMGLHGGHQQPHQRGGVLSAKAKGPAFGVHCEAWDLCNIMAATQVRHHGFFRLSAAYVTLQAIHARCSSAHSGHCTLSAPWNWMSCLALPSWYWRWQRRQLWTWKKLIRRYTVLHIVQQQSAKITKSSGDPH